MAGLLELTIIAGNVLASVLTERTGPLAWLAAPAVAVAVAMGKLLIEEYAGPRSPSPRLPSPRQPGPGRPLPRQAYPPPVEQWQPPQRRGSLLVPLAVVLALLGGVGYAITFGARYVTGYVTGDEAGVERLVEPVATTSQGLRLAVDSVVQTAHFTRVGITATNGTGDTLTLPVFSNANLVAPDGTALEADPFRSDWSDSIVPSGTRRGVLVFPGHVPDTATSLELSFATVYGRNGPDSVTLPGITLRSSQESADVATARSTGGLLALQVDED